MRANIAIHVEFAQNSCLFTCLSRVVYAEHTKASCITHSFKAKSTSHLIN